MARKNKVRADRIIILILTFILILGVLGLGAYKLFEMFSKKDEQSKPSTPVNIETTEGVKVTCNDYDIYYDETDELKFNFIIAELKFEANEPVSFDFKNLKTSEKIYLNDINKYIKKLELASYDVSKLGVNTSSSIASDDHSVTTKLLIPFNTNASNLSLYNAVDASKIDFDLTKERIPVTVIKLSNTETQVEVGTTKVSITNAYISTFMVHNDEPYELGSTTQMYSFEITVLEAQDNVQISDAIFIENGSDEEIHCKASEYHSIDMKNILGVNLTQGTVGGLFFEVNSTDQTVHNGKLLIKFTNSDKYFELFKED